MKDRIVLGIFLLIALVCGLQAYADTAADPAVRHTVVKLEDYPEGSRPIRILLLSDLHISGPDTGPQKITRIVKQANALNPDVVMLAGDFLAHKIPVSRPGLNEAIAPLKKLTPPLGTYAVLGNHDHWDDPGVLKSALQQADVTVLQNQAAQVGPLALAGVDDQFSGHARTALTLNKLNKTSGAKVLLSHSPDIMPETPSSVGLVLAGHTHCGQIAAPVFGPLVTLSKYGQRYACGRIDENGKTLIVTSGIGTSIIPIRFLAPPDMWLITLQRRT